MNYITYTYTYCLYGKIPFLLYFLTLISGPLPFCDPTLVRSVSTVKIRLTPICFSVPTLFLYLYHPSDRAGRGAAAAGGDGRGHDGAGLGRGAGQGRPAVGGPVHLEPRQQRRLQVRRQNTVHVVSWMYHTVKLRQRSLKGKSYLNVFKSE